MIPPEFRTSSSFHPAALAKPVSPGSGSGQERKATNNWTNNPVEMWSKEQVGAFDFGLRLGLCIVKILHSLQHFTSKIQIKKHLVGDVF